jgi:glycosyltransferase involved in cell wall biosynthesis
LDVKGIQELWSAFERLSDDFPEWELHCIGTGDLWDKRTIHPKIVHHGFKQPDELAAHLEDAACFVMPSKKEPWGVVLHEMAIAGLPLLVSDQVGAGATFLEVDKNGFSFQLIGLESALRRFISMSSSQKREMAEKSYVIGSNYTPTRWNEACIQFLKS